MKKLCLFLITALPMFCFGQGNQPIILQSPVTPNGVSFNKGWGRFSNIDVNYTFSIPFGTSATWNNANHRTGALFYRTTDSAFLVGQADGSFVTIKGGGSSANLYLNGNYFLNDGSTPSLAVKWNPTINMQNNQYFTPNGYSMIFGTSSFLSFTDVAFSANSSAHSLGFGDRSMAATHNGDTVMHWIMLDTAVYAKNNTYWFDTLRIRRSPINPYDGVRKKDLDSLGAIKQNLLISGVNIKTVNSNSLLGSGDLAFPVLPTITATHTTTTTVPANTMTPFNVSTFNVNALLPTSPINGTVCGVALIGTTGGNTVTVNTGGTIPINKSGGPTTLVISQLNQTVILEYVSATNVWQILASYIDQSGIGTVTSVAATPSQGVTISGSPITTSGTLGIGLGNITPTSLATTIKPSTIYQTPAGTAGTDSIMVKHSGGVVDAISPAYYVAASDGTYVKSVVLNTPNVLYTTPINFSTSSNTATGTLSLNTQSANTVFAGPTTGSAATPAFRALVAADLPTGIPNANLANSSITINGNSVSLGGSTTVTANTTNALTLGRGLLGGSFNGGSAVTAILDTTQNYTFLKPFTVQSTTTNQLNVNYDGTHGMTVAVNSAGLTTFNTTTSFAFTPNVAFNGSVTFGSTNSNLYNPQAAAAQSTAVSQYQFFGGSTNFVRNGFYGNSSTSLTSGATYSSVILGTTPITTFSSGTHPFLANLVINPLTVTSGGATTTNTASLFIQGAASGGTNNYAFYVNGGTSLFNGALYATGTLGTTANSATANFFVNTTNAVAGSVSTASLLFGGAANVQERAQFAGSGSTTLATGTSYANLIVGGSPVTTFSSGTHGWLVNEAVNRLGTVTSGGATVTNTANLYVDAQSASIGTHNYGLYSAGETWITSTILGSVTAAINSTNTATAAQLAGGTITSTSAAATTITLPTATLMATQIGAVQGTTFEFTIDNSAGANTVTVALGSGMTQLSIITGSNTLTIASGSVGVFRLYFSSTTAAYFSRIE